VLFTRTLVESGYVKVEIPPGYDEVDCIEESFAANSERERDPGMSIPVTAHHHLVTTRTRYDVPRAAAHVVTQVHLLLTLETVALRLYWNLAEWSRWGCQRPTGFLRCFGTVGWVT